VARSKPLSRKARRDLNSIAMREDFNRANQLRRDKDKTKIDKIKETIVEKNIELYKKELLKNMDVNN